MEAQARLAEATTISLAEGREYIQRQCGSFERFQAVLSFELKMDEWDWLRLLGEAWECSDNIGEHIAELLDTPSFSALVDNPVYWRKALMNPEERAFLASLPETVTVWRGCYDLNRLGLSWTLDRQTARRFPMLNRYWQAGTPLLLKATVQRDSILAIKLGRHEQEVIVWPERLDGAWRLKPRAIFDVRRKLADA